MAEIQVKNNTILLGLDISSYSTGWAVMDATGKLITYGHINPEGPLEKRLSQTRNFLIKIIAEHKPTFVALEDLNCFRNAKVSRILNYFSGVAVLTCYDYNGNEVRFYSQSTLKKLMGINPKALKKDGYNAAGVKEFVVKAVEDKYKITLERDNKGYYRDVADAISVAARLYAEVKTWNI